MDEILGAMNPHLAQAVAFMHPEKLLTFTATLDEALIAARLGVDAATYRAIKSGFAAKAGEAAQASRE